MKPEVNPYASPTAQPPTPVPIAVDVDAVSQMPALPITFRPSALSLLFMVPTGVFMASITCMFLVGAASQRGYGSFGVALVALACACLTAIPAFGCLMVLRCKVVANDSAIEKTDFPKKAILYSRIQSWHHHPVTKTVYVSLLESNDYMPISNWAMSKEGNELLGAVLRAKVGPPSG